MAYSVGDFKKMMKDAYKTAFGYRGATGFNIYRRYAGNKFRYCSECEVNELNAPGGFTHWIPKANPTDPKKVKYIGFWFGVYITDATGTRMDLHYIHFIHSCFEKKECRQIRPHSFFYFAYSTARVSRITVTLI